MTDMDVKEPGLAGWTEWEKRQIALAAEALRRNGLTEEVALYLAENDARMLRLEEAWKKGARK